MVEEAQFPEARTSVRFTSEMDTREAASPLLLCLRTSVGDLGFAADTPT